MRIGRFPVLIIDCPDDCDRTVAYGDLVYENVKVCSVVLYC